VCGSEVRTSGSEWECEGELGTLGCAPLLRNAPSHQVGLCPHFGISSTPLTFSEVASTLAKLALVFSQLGTHEKHVSELFPSSPKK
jgi:hypothetical protein